MSENTFDAPGTDAPDTDAAGTDAADTDALASDAPEVEEVATRLISCDGGGAAYGHPRVWMQIGDEGWVECGYCDKKFVLKPGSADH